MNPELERAKELAEGIKKYINDIADGDNEYDIRADLRCIQSELEELSSIAFEIMHKGK